MRTGTTTNKIKHTEGCKNWEAEEADIGGEGTRDGGGTDG
tara:strand:+ start:428 stop:547 length:120 start_codon:yes stop_codon:yes gene_type:complete